MKSPFPGVDPYLQQSWGDIHTSITTYAADQLNHQMPGDLVARIEEYVALAPDARIVEYPDMNGAAATAESDVAVAEPETQRRLVIYDINSGLRIVTVIEFLSRSNKYGEAERASYHRKQLDFLAARVNIVEIDLLRDGPYCLYPPYNVIPERCRSPYRISIVRGTEPGVAGMYRTSLREKLPTIHIPLRPKDTDVKLNLQALIDQTYANGRYSRTIDYHLPPDPPLSKVDAEWANELLTQAGKR